MAKKTEAENQQVPQPKKNGIFKQILKGLGIEGVADIGVMAAIIVAIIKLSPLARHIPQSASAGGHTSHEPVKGSGLTSRKDETQYGDLTAELEKDDPDALPLLHQIYWAIPPTVNPNDNWATRIQNAIVQMIHQSRYRTEIVNMPIEITGNIKKDHRLEFLKLLVSIAKSKGIPAVIDHLQSCNIIPSGKVSAELESAIDSGIHLIKTSTSTTSKWAENAGRSVDTWFMRLRQVALLMIAILFGMTIYIWDPINSNKKNIVIAILFTVTLLFSVFALKKHVTKWFMKIRGGVQ